MTTLNTDFKVKHGLSVNGNTTLYGTSNTLGTVTSGIWHGSPVPLQYGGTGLDLSSSSGYFLLNAGTLTISTTIPATAITGTLTNPTTGNADTATKLATARTINMTGDVSWSSSLFDGSGNVTGVSTLATQAGLSAGSYTMVTVNTKGLVTSASNPTTLAGYGITDAVLSNTAITAGTSTKITYDAKGLVTGGSALSAADIPNLDWAKITTGKPTTLTGYGITDAQAKDADLTAIAALAGTSGLLRKTAADTWSLDTNAYLTGNQTITLSGDVSGSGTGAITTTLATMAGLTPAEYGSATAIPVVTVDGKGRITAISTTAVSIPSGSLSFTGDVSGTGTTGSTTTLTLATIADSGTGTFKKVTTNSKGLVTGTAAVTQTDITGLLGVGAVTNTMLANTAVANLSGSNTGDQTITLTGDVTGSGTGSFAATLANSGATAGTYGSSTLTPVVTVDAKGRVTNVTSTTINTSNVSGGAALQVLYQSGPSTTAFVAAPTTANTILQWNGSNFVWATMGDAPGTYTSSTTAANQVIDTNAVSAVGTIKYTIQVTFGTARQSCDMLVTHDGTTSVSVEFANIATGATLATFDTDISGGNVRLLATPTNAVTSFKIVKTVIAP